MKTCAGRIVAATAGVAAVYLEKAVMELQKAPYFVAEVMSFTTEEKVMRQHLYLIHQVLANSLLSPWIRMTAPRVQ